VHAWHARTTDAWRDPSRVARALEWLPTADRVRYTRYRFDADRHMFLLGRVMARALVGRALGVAPAAWRWTEGAHGRPCVDDPDCALSFNLAHSADTVVCALAWHREVGVDVEDLGRRPVERELVRRFCAPAELADIEAQGDDGWHDRFLRYWTLKEAYLKARGLGIAVHLADLSFSLTSESVRLHFLNSLVGSDDCWTFDMHELPGRQIVAVAASARDERPEFSLQPFPDELMP